MAGSVVSSTKQLVDSGDARVASQRTKALARVARIRKKEPETCLGPQTFLGSLLQKARLRHSSTEYDRVVRPRLMTEHAAAAARDDPGRVRQDSLARQRYLRRTSSWPEFEDVGMQLGWGT